MDSAFILLCALVLNALFAGPRRLYVSMGLLALAQAPARKLRDVERRLNREHRARRELEIRGYIMLAAGVSAALAIGWLLSGLSALANGFIAIIIIASLLPVRPTLDFALAVKRALLSGQIAEARASFSGTPWRHHAVMDEHALSRAAIETLAVHFSERIMCPALAYMLGGLPLMFACMFITLLHDIVSPGAFALAAKKAYRFVHWLPSRVAACLWVCSALFLPEGKLKQSWRRLAPLLLMQPPQPLMVACAGHVLMLSLGGPSSIYAAGAWHGVGTTKAMPLHIGRAAYLFVVLNLLVLILLGLAL